MITYRINVRNLQGIGNNRTGGAAPSGPHRNVIILCIFYKIPNNQEIINKAHIFYRIQFVIQPLPQLLSHYIIALFDSFPA